MDVKKGEVLLSVELIPKWKAEVSVVGKGRDEPNINPKLPPPVGRLHLSWNPFDLLV